MNVIEIYNNLYAGKCLEVEFNSKEDAFNFRSKLAVYKCREDKYMRSIGMLLREGMTEFSFVTNIPRKTATDEEQQEFYITGKVIVKMAFREKEIRKQYIVRILGEEEEKDFHTQEDIVESNRASNEANEANEVYERVEYNE